MKKRMALLHLREEGGIREYLEGRGLSIVMFESASEIILLCKEADTEESIMISDEPAHMRAAKKMGMLAVWVRPKGACHIFKNPSDEPDEIVGDSMDVMDMV